MEIQTVTSLDKTVLRMINFLQRCGAEGMVIQKYGERLEHVRTTFDGRQILVRLNHAKDFYVIFAV